MNQSISNFLSFKGKSLLFLSAEGIIWIAIKPVCEALKVDYRRQARTIMSDPVLGAAWSNQTIQIPGDQKRMMTCLPEKLVYGWLFSIRSNSKELLEYKMECYNILFDHFHGTFSIRQKVLKEKALIRRKLISLQDELYKDEKFLEYQRLRGEEMRLGITLKDIDRKEVGDQLSLFIEN
ncbi:MAG: phage antirepressor N-terminal domain-containing protein [Bacteroidales bacterium]